jgi:hypothetical protein
MLAPVCVANQHCVGSGARFCIAVLRNAFRCTGRNRRSGEHAIAPMHMSICNLCVGKPTYKPAVIRQSRCFSKRSNPVQIRYVTRTDSLCRPQPDKQLPDSLLQVDRLEADRRGCSKTDIDHSGSPVQIKLAPVIGCY